MADRRELLTETGFADLRTVTEVLVPAERDTSGGR